MFDDYVGQPFWAAIPTGIIRGVLDGIDAQSGTLAISEPLFYGVAAEMAMGTVALVKMEEILAFGPSDRRPLSVK